jgi:hypothetical protein
VQISADDMGANGWIDVPPGGHFEKSLPAGRYILRAYGAASYGSFGPPTPVGVPAGGEVHVTLAAPEQGAILAGVVLEPKGGVAQNASVHLLSLGVAQQRLTDEHGRFSFQITPGSQASLRVLLEGRTAMVSAQASSEVVVQLRPSASIFGRVITRRGAVGHYQVTTDCKTFGNMMVNRWQKRMFQAETFLLAELPADTVRVAVETEEGQHGSVELTLLPGETSVAEIVVD